MQKDKKAPIVKCPICQLAIGGQGNQTQHTDNGSCWGDSVPILNEETKAIWWYWRNKKKGSLRDDKSFTLSATDMVQLFTEAGITAADIGHAGHQYQLGRYGDTGGYEMGNCRFITKKENLQEKREPQCKALWADGVLYESISDASRASGITRASGRGRIRSKNFTDWYLV